MFDLTIGVFALGLIIGACFVGFRNFFKIDEQRATIHLTMTPQASVCLTLAMIVRNEERHIGRCLKSVQGLADEIVVVDTGSTDRTKLIALESGAKVLDFPWSDDFSAARNHGLEAAQGRWILVLDADEYLSEASVQAIREITKSIGDMPRAFQLINKSTTDNGVTGISGLIVRLFPNDPRVRYEWPVHEQVVTSLQRAGITIENTSIEIIHTGYSSVEVNAAKQARNLRILETITAAEKESHPMAWFLKGGALLDLGRTEEALSAYNQCAAMTLAGDSVHEGALVRKATCFAELKQPEEICAINPLTPQSTWHPELLFYRGQAELDLGHSKEGLIFLHSVFETPSRPMIPAYDPVRIRIRALMAIASFWEKMDPSRGVALLRLASDALKTGRQITLEEVLAIQRT